MFFSDEQLERLRSYPDIGREELIGFFTLTRRDLGFVDNLGRAGGRGPAARLGLTVQLCTLPWLGFVPDDLWSVPQAAVLRLANQLGVFPGVLEQYGRRAQTRSDHLKLVLKYPDWKPVPTGGEPLKDLEQFLQDRAMEHDTPSLLFHQAAEFLVSAHVVRPGVVTLIRQRTREGMDIARQEGRLRGKQPSLKPAQDREIRRMHDTATAVPPGSPPCSASAGPPSTGPSNGPLRFPRSRRRPPGARHRQVRPAPDRRAGRRDEEVLTLNQTPAPPPGVVSDGQESAVLDQVTVISRLLEGTPKAIIHGYTVNGGTAALKYSLPGEVTGLM